MTPSVVVIYVYVHFFSKFLFLTTTSPVELLFM
jgi:hypothetical protein